MTFIVTDGNVLIADRCQVATYRNTLIDEEVKIKHDVNKIYIPEKEVIVNNKNHKLIVGGFSGDASVIQKITSCSNHFGNMREAYCYYLEFNGESNCPSFLGITDNKKIIKIDADEIAHYNKGLVAIGSGINYINKLISYVPKMTPLEALVLAYRSDDGVSRNFDYWCNGKVTENVTLTEKQENNILDKIQKRFDIRRLNLKE